MTPSDRGNFLVPVRGIKTNVRGGMKSTAQVGLGAKIVVGGSNCKINVNRWRNLVDSTNHAQATISVTVQIGVRKIVFGRIQM